VGGGGEPAARGLELAFVVWAAQCSTFLTAASFAAITSAPGRDDRHGYLVQAAPQAHAS
jgi:hypothetical protein